MSGSLYLVLVVVVSSSLLVATRYSTVQIWTSSLVSLVVVFTNTQ